jgi:hypothetical protein
MVVEGSIRIIIPCGRRRWQTLVGEDALTGLVYGLKSL